MVLPSSEPIGIRSIHFSQSGPQVKYQLATHSPALFPVLHFQDLLQTFLFLHVHAPVIAGALYQERLLIPPAAPVEKIHFLKA